MPSGRALRKAELTLCIKQATRYLAAMREAVTEKSFQRLDAGLAYLQVIDGGGRGHEVHGLMDGASGVTQKEEPMGFTGAAASTRVFSVLGPSVVTILSTSGDWSGKAVMLGSSKTIISNDGVLGLPNRDKGRGRHIGDVEDARPRRVLAIRIFQRTRIEMSSGF